MGSNLRERVNDQAAKTTPGTEVDTRREGPATLGQHIKAMEREFAAAMPQGTEAAQLVRDALTALRTQPKLAEADRLSVLGSLMTCAQLGLRPNVAGLGHAWVLPFWDRNYSPDGQRKGGCRAQLIIGYQGYRELAMRSGMVSDLIGRVVHEHDRYEVAFGLDEKLVHEPYLDGPRGAARHYYAIARYQGGGHSFFCLSRWEAEEHRDRHAMAKAKDGRILGPWRDHFDAMALKTAFLKLAKWMPKSAAMAAAIAADGTLRVDLRPDPEVMHQGQRVDAEAVVDAEVVGEHATGHGVDEAWFAGCPECEGDTAGELHAHEHASPQDGCGYCEREAVWKAGR